MKKSIKIVTLILAMAVALCSCSSSKKDDTKDKADATSSPSAQSGDLGSLTKNTIDASIILEDGEEIELELYPEIAPITVENFVELAGKNFYDGLIFHRVIEDFMIQGGGYDENYNEKKTSSIKGEFESNGVKNPLSHTRGVISMARTQIPDSASSQFFIVQQDATYLDGEYAAFGRVTSGMDIVDEIASVKTTTVPEEGMEDVPAKPIVIDTIVINDASGMSKSSGKSSGKSSSGSSSSFGSSSSGSKSSSSSISDDEDDEFTGSSSSIGGSSSGSSSSSSKSGSSSGSSSSSSKSGSSSGSSSSSSKSGSSSTGGSSSSSSSGTSGLGSKSSNGNS